MSKKLYIPGPVEVSQDVLEAMATPMIGHRMKEYAELHKEVVEDLILAAIKDAQSKAADKAQEEMGKLTESLGLPKDMKLPF